MSDRQLRQALEALAYRVHRARGAEAEAAAAEITGAELGAALDDQLPGPAAGRIDQRRVRDELLRRSSILIAGGEITGARRRRPRRRAGPGPERTRGELAL